MCPKIIKERFEEIESGTNNEKESATINTTVHYLIACQIILQQMVKKKKESISNQQ